MKQIKKYEADGSRLTTDSALMQKFEILKYKSLSGCSSIILE